MTRLSTYTDLRAAGIPANGRFGSAIAKAVEDQTKVSAVFDDLAAVTDLLQEAAAGSITWITSTTEPGDLPVRFIMESSGTDTRSVVLTLFPFAGVIAGSEPPEVFTDPTGATYYQVAAVEFSARISDQLAYLAVMRVGVPTATDPAEFPSVDWDATLSPVLDGLIDALTALYARPADSDGSAKVETAKPRAAVDAAVVIGQGALIALTVIKIVKMVVTIVQHSSAVQTLVCNFTSAPVTFDSTYLYDTGEVQYANTQGLSLAGLEGFTLGAPEAVAIASGQSLSLLPFATVSQVSAKGLQGVGLSLVAQTTGGTAAVLVDIPWAGDNSVNAVGGYPQDAAAFWSDYSGQLSGPPATAALGTTARAVLNIDALSGKQPEPDGYLAYFYRSLLVFEPA